MSVLPVKSDALLPLKVTNQVEGYSLQHNNQQKLNSIINEESNQNSLQPNTNIKYEVDFYGFPVKGIYLDVLV